MSNDLSHNRVDTLVAGAKAALGFIPIAGPFLSELVGSLIPNQRIDRLSHYVKQLDERLSKLDSEKLIAASKSEEGIDLIEEGFIQASRAISDERRIYIANIVSQGINDESIEFLEAKYALKLLAELNDLEVLWLRFYADPTLNGDQAFRSKHENVFSPVQAFLGSDEREHERAALQDSYVEHLERLSLIKGVLRVDKKTGMPAVDKLSGKLEISYRVITPLGRMVLKLIGLNDAEI